MPPDIKTHFVMFTQIQFYPKELFHSIKLKPIYMLSQFYHPKAILADTNYQC